jgi:hypothetical protein
MCSVVVHVLPMEYQHVLIFGNNTVVKLQELVYVMSTRVMTKICTSTYSTVQLVFCRAPGTMKQLTMSGGSQHRFMKNKFDHFSFRYSTAFVARIADKTNKKNNSY